MERLKYMSLFILSIFIQSCSTDTKEYKVGEQLDESNKVDSVLPGVFDVRTGYLIEEIIVDDVQMLFSRNDDGDTTKKWTFDNNFITPEGYKVGMTWGMIPAELQKKVSKSPGWDYSIKLQSGWRICFCEGESCTDTLPSDTSRVKWIEKWN